VAQRSRLPGVPRSFSDHNGDGIGDVLGIIDRLTYLAELGIDAIWVSPWYPSPMVDGGYDVSDYRDIHPVFGTLEQAETFIARAHDHGLRVLIDLVPNHSSDRHPRFQSALAAGPGSAERELYIFRDGARSNGSTPPNNWPAMFGGGAWERTTNPDGSAGQWYPTLTWDDDVPDGVLSFTREPGFRCVVNIGPEPYEVPADAEVLISSGLAGTRSVGRDEAVWLRG
jgi:glycosidase